MRKASGKAILRTEGHAHIRQQQYLHDLIEKYMQKPRPMSTESMGQHLRLACFRNYAPLNIEVLEKMYRIMLRHDPKMLLFPTDKVLQLSSFRGPEQMRKAILKTSARFIQ